MTMYVRRSMIIRAFAVYQMVEPPKFRQHVWRMVAERVNQTRGFVAEELRDETTHIVQEPQ